MEKYKKIIKNNKFKISVPTWNEEFELPDESCSVSDIQKYFEYISKTHETITNNPSIKIYVNKIENRITFKIKTGYYLKDKNSENVPYLEITEVVLLHFNTANNIY